MDEPPQLGIRHKVWKRQLADRTRQLKQGADKARQRTELEMLDGSDIVREVEATGAGHGEAGAGPESELGPAAEEGAEDASELEDWSEEDWIAGIGVNLEEAAAEVGAGTESEVEPAAEEPWWVVVDSNTGVGTDRAVELNKALQAFVANVEVGGALSDGQLAMQLGDLGGQRGWRLGLIRLTAGVLTPTVSAACMVSEARARGGRMIRMMALAVDGEMRGQGLATKAIRRLKGRAAVGEWAEVWADG